MEIYTTSQARENLYKLVDYVADSHEPVYILGKRNKAVMISEEDFRMMQETLYLSAIPGMKESLLKSREEPIENFSDKLDWEE